MHNYHIMHKVFLACTIIGSTPSVLGHLFCPSQQLMESGAYADMLTRPGLGIFMGLGIGLITNTESPIFVVLRCVGISLDELLPHASA
jgi:hypothetical protein